MEDLKRVEEEMTILQSQVEEKERTLVNQKGNAYASIPNFNEFAANLREKTEKAKKLKEELKEIRQICDL